MEKTILVIEDEKVTRNNLLQFLESEGFITLEAENGNTGIHIAGEHLPDLIICDILMPEMDGYDVLFYLQQNPDTKRIPFIFLTVTNEQEIFATNNALSEYEYDYLQKPVTSEQLRKAIKSKLVWNTTQLSDFPPEQQLNKLEEKLRQLEEYSQTKDLLLSNLCQNLKKYLPAINKEIKTVINTDLSSSQQESISKIQKDIATLLTIVNQASELQELINIDNYRLLQQFMDNNQDS